MKWTVTRHKKSIPALKAPILIEGLPGIGNTGKVAIDFITEETKAEKLYELFSYDLPHSVFINEENLVELPSISLYFKKTKKRDLLLLAGDVQPTNERSSYEFSEKVLDIFQQLKGKEIITLGGIGLPTIPKKPKVYCTGNSKEIIKRYSEGTNIENRLYGVVGPIMGVSGILLGLAKKRNIQAISLLAETYGHPMYLGIRGAREVVKVLNKVLSIDLNMKNIDREVKEIEENIEKKTAGFEQKPSQISKLKTKMSPDGGYDVSYIG